jgi:hypothetical protein
MEIAQLLLSLLLGWGLDTELDQISETRLGLLKPLVPVSFGQLSKAGRNMNMSEIPPMYLLQYLHIPEHALLLFPLRLHVPHVPDLETPLNGSRGFGSWS